MSAKKILFLLYNYPPEFGTAPKRNFRLFAAISGYFSDYHVITVVKDTREKTNKITEIKPLDYRAFVRKTSSSGSIPETLKKNFLSHFLIRILNTYPINLFLGEGGGAYMFRQYRIAKKLIKEQDFTHIYSSYRPIADHYTAARLKRKFPHLVWLADFRDLIVDPHYRQQYFPQIHQRVYRKLFRNADALLTISSSFAEKLKEYNPVVFSIPNGVPANIVHSPPLHTDYFTMVYTGSMFLNERNAEPVFTAVHKLINEKKINADKIRIIYAGKDHLEWIQLAEKYGAEHYFINKGIIKGAEAIELQKYANINILLTMSSDQLTGVFTGKLVEYLEAGSPILSIAKGQNDPLLATMITELNAGICVSDQVTDSRQTEQFICDEYNEWINSQKNARKMSIDILRDKYTMDTIIGPLKPFLQ